MAYPWPPVPVWALGPGPERRSKGVAARCALLASWLTSPGTPRG